GVTAGAGNLISGHSRDGIVCAGVSDVIEGNRIGTDVSGTYGIPNGDGIRPASNNIIGGTVAGAGNTIAINNRPGVWVVGDSVNGYPTLDSIESNSIYNNVGLGIALGDPGVPLLNDSQGHVGPNNYLNFPVITAATFGPTTTTVSGTFSEAN